jgi:hypothetical protein
MEVEFLPVLSVTLKVSVSLEILAHFYLVYSESKSVFSVFSTDGS